MYRIGVISDTHGLLREEVKAHLKDCQAILHAGDIQKPEVLEELSQIAQTRAVRGNVDKEAWAAALPETLWVSLAGLKIFMIHNKKLIREDISDADLVIFGHSHKYEEFAQGKQRWLNPGSCGARRFSLPVNMAVIEVEKDKAFRIRKIDLCVKEPVQKSEELPAGREREIIGAIMREMQRGKSVAVMAARHQISEELTDQICRVIVTHPGVDVNGILNRMQILRKKK